MSEYAVLCEHNTVARKIYNIKFTVVTCSLEAATCLLSRTSWKYRNGDLRNVEVKSCFSELSWDFSWNIELCWSDCMPRMMSGRSLCWCRTLCLLLNPHTPSSRTCCGRSSVCPAVTINCSSTGSRCKSGSYLTHQINMFEQVSSWEASGRPACQEIPLLVSGRPACQEIPS